MVDGGRNNASILKNILILDITPPEIELLGSRVFNPGEEAWYNVSVADNSPSGSPGPTYLWQLFFIDGGSPDPVSTSEDSSFRVTMVEPGNYTLMVTVWDASGNGRNDSIQLLVRKPIVIEERDTGSDDSIPYDYIAVGIIVIGILLLMTVIFIIAGRRRYSKDVDMEWDDEDYDMEELDDIEEEDEIDWEDEDFESWE
jgi:hypothetical protein